MKKISKNEKGCPCNRDCCDDPIVGGTDHECPEEGFCEECYASHCRNCGETCYCEL